MIKKYDKRLFWCLFLGLVLRLTYITIPILEVEPFEQTQLAWHARDLFQNRFMLPVLHYTYAVDSIYSYLIALSYVFCGGVHEWAGRILGILFALGTAKYLYIFTKLLSGKREAIWAVIIFWLSPLSIIYTRTFLPESAIVFCSIGAMYHMETWVRGVNSRGWRHAILFCMGAMLLRPLAIYLWVPLAFQLYQKEGLEALWSRKFFLLLVIPTFVTGVWSYMIALNGEHFPFWVNYLWKDFSVDLLWTGEYWKKMIGHLGGKTLTPIGLLFFLKAFWVNRVDKYNVLHVWLGVFVVFLLLMNQEVMAEKHYLLTFLVLASMYMGIELGKGDLGFSQKVPRWVKTSLNLVLAISVATQLSMAYTLPEHYRYMREAGEDLQNYAEEDDKILSTRRLYYCNRLGWSFSLYRELDSDYLIEEFEKYRQLGMRYFVMTEPENYSHHTEFLGHVLQHSEEIVVAKGYRIYRV
jgi:4-amino-4-deoxy-L-arabinose transferase-like glycosyltransferase